MSIAIAYLPLDIKYLALAVVVIVFLGYQWTSYSRLSNFKGPSWAAITNLWMFKCVYLRRAHLDLYQVSQRYGSLPYAQDKHLHKSLTSHRGTGSDWS